MTREILKSKIHRASVTDANIDYIGSITIDEALMEAADLIEFEKVMVADVDNGERFETYVIKGARGSGIICINGAAAHLVSLGDKVIIMAFTWLEDPAGKAFTPSLVFVDEKNRIKR